MDNGLYMESLQCDEKMHVMWAGYWHKNYTDMLTYLRIKVSHSKYLITKYRLLV